MFHIELIIEFLENVMNNIVQVAILFFEFVGVIVIILSGLKGFYNYVRRVPDMKITLAAGRGEGAQALGEAVRRVLGVANLDPSAPCLVSQRQYAAACEGRAALEEAENALAGGFGLDAVSVCVDDALSALCRLTGEDASEAVVEEVFSTFCVGK